MLAEALRLHRIDMQPLAGARHQHAQRMAKQRQRSQPALFFNGQRGHRHVQLAVHHRLLNGQAAELGYFKLDAGIALAKQANRPGHHHSHHRRNAEAQNAFVQMIDIAKLGLQLAEFGEDRQPAFKHHSSGVGQQQLASVADQQGAVQLIFEVFQHLADGRLGHKQLFRCAGKTLLTNHFDKIAQRSYVHDYSSGLCIR